MSDKLKTLEDQLAAAVLEQQTIDEMNEQAWNLKDSDPRQALKLSEETYKRATTEPFGEHPYQFGVAFSLRNLGYLHLRQSNYDQALIYSFQSLNLFKKLETSKEQAGILSTIGSVYWRLANYPEALAYQLEALKIFEVFGDKEGEADTLNNMGLVYGDAGDPVQELAAYQQALQLQQEIENKRGQAIALNNISEVYHSTGDYSQALHYGFESLKLAQETDDKVGEAYTLDGLGVIYLAIHAPEQALPYFQQSLALCQEIGDKRGEMTVQLNLGRMCYQQQDISQALAYFHQSLALAEEIEARSEQFLCHSALAGAYKAQGDFEIALTHYEQFHTIKEAVFNAEADNRLKSLQVIHNTETTKKEAEIYQLKNVALEQEINDRKRAEAALRQAKDALEVANAALSAANQQMQNDLALARRAQDSLLRDPRPRWPDLQVICYSQPAYQVGGDFYSYNIIPDKTTLSGATYSFAVGDVSGKGVSASLLMAVSLSRFDASFSRVMAPVERIIHLDKALLPYAQPHRQNCALSYIEVTPPGKDQRGLVRVVNAGGIPPYLKRADGSIEWLEVGGFALGQGLGAQVGYQERSFTLSRGDLVILLSDGVVEANTSTNDIFGFERLEEALHTGPVSDVQAMLDHILDRISAFVGTAESHDDLTVVIIQV